MKLEMMLIGLAEVFGVELSETRLKSYTIALEDINSDQLRVLFKKLCQTCKRFPSPAEILEIGSVTVTDNDQAREIASRIWQAIPRFGYPNGSDARDYIGEIGWSIVQSMGGWDHLCSSINNRERGIFMAQARDLASVRVKHGLPETYNDNQIESTSSNAGLTQIMNIKELK